MEQVYRVSQVNAYLRNLIEKDRLLSFLTVEGEVSNCKYHNSGHVYFSLKERDSQLNCVMFARLAATGLPFRMRDGMQVCVSGRISVYERDGRYQMYAERVTMAGIGALYEELERRKRKLAEEGLFASEHKRELPRYPKRIGIVTASTGAALQDILQILGRRNPYIQPVLSPCKVQGDGAADSICRAIRRMERADVDVMIVGRGGGSIEDLWAFNEEAVVRTVYSCRVPVISAVGHEINTTLIDYVADRYAPTPSAAAELASYEVADVEAQLVDFHYDLYRLMKQKTEAIRLQLRNNRDLLMRYSPRATLQAQKEHLTEFRRQMRWMTEKAVADETERMDRLAEQLTERMNRRVSEERTRLQILTTRLDALSPTKTLSKGYGFLMTDGHAVNGIDDLKEGTTIRGYVKDGGFEAEILKTVRNPE